MAMFFHLIETRIYIVELIDRDFFFAIGFFSLPFLLHFSQTFLNTCLNSLSLLHWEHLINQSIRTKPNRRKLRVREIDNNIAVIIIGFLCLLFAGSKESSNNQNSLGGLSFFPLKIFCCILGRVQYQGNIHAQYF